MKADGLQDLVRSRSLSAGGATSQAAEVHKLMDLFELDDRPRGPYAILLTPNVQGWLRKGPHRSQYRGSARGPEFRS